MTNDPFPETGFRVWFIERKNTIFVVCVSSDNFLKIRIHQKDVRCKWKIKMWHFINISCYRCLCWRWLTDKLSLDPWMQDKQNQNKKLWHRGKSRLTSRRKHEAGHLNPNMERKRKEEGTMEERPAGKEKKRKTMREEDRRWKRLPWPGPQSLTRDEEPPDPHQPNHHPAVRHSEEADDKGMLEKKRSKKNNFVFSSLGCQFTTKLPGCHLATILVALLSILVRPTVGGEDLIETHYKPQKTKKN